MKHVSDPLLKMLFNMHKNADAEGKKVIKEMIKDVGDIVKKEDEIKKRAAS